MKFTYMSSGRYICGDWLVHKESDEWVVYYAYQRCGSFPTMRAGIAFCKEISG